jgi:phosphatidylglycerophosphate synthase
MTEYIDPDRPKTYVYRSENKSIVDKYLLCHWWPIAIRAFPPSVPANLISMLGNLGTWIAFLILSGVLLGPMDDFGRRNPWIFGIVALLLFFYQTLDALDGIQARRTDQAGPLGEFVDHWFDSFNVFLLPLGVIVAFPSLPPTASLFTILVFVASDWISLREVVVRDTLVFEALSTEEGQFIEQLFFLSTWVLGYGFWEDKAFLGLSPIVILFGLFSLAMLVFAWRIAVRVGGFRELGAEMLSLLPLIAWTGLSYRGDRAIIVMGGLLVGLSGSRFTGALLRHRLLGAAYRTFIPDILVLDLVLLASALVPGLPAWLPRATGAAALAWTAGALALQFRSSVLRVREVLGIGLFGRVRRGSGSDSDLDIRKGRG